MGEDYVDIRVCIENVLESGFYVIRVILSVILTLRIIVKLS